MADMEPTPAEIRERLDAAELEFKTLIEKVKAILDLLDKP